MYFSKSSSDSSVTPMTDTSLEHTHTHTYKRHAEINFIITSVSSKQPVKQTRVSLRGLVGLTRADSQSLVALECEEAERCFQTGSRIIITPQRRRNKTHVLWKNASWKQKRSFTPPELNRKATVFTGDG